MLQPIFEIISSPENHSRIHLREWPGNSRIPTQISRYAVHNVKYGVPLCVQEVPKSASSHSILQDFSA